MITHVLLVLACLLWILPVIATVVSSFLPSAFSVDHGWWEAFFQRSFVSTNYRNLVTTFDLPHLVWASLVMAVPVTVIGVFIASAAAYALAWLNVPGKIFILMGIVALLVIPPQISLAPLLSMMNSVGLGNSIVAVWVLQVGLSLPFGIMVLHAAFESVPKELVEAAIIDGASSVTVFTRVLVPVTGGSIAGVAVIYFLWGWNELLGPLVFLGANSSASNFTLQIANLAGGETLDLNLLLTAALVSILLPVAVFFLLQRFFVRGVMGGAVKG